jgi:hypothetical protein
MTPHRHARDTAACDVDGIAARLLDDVYTAWSQAQCESRDALRAWLGTGGGHHGAYDTYRAALDREEAAAIDLERLSRVVPP